MGKKLTTLVDEHGRVCTKCGDYKTWGFFYKRKEPHGLQWYHSECISCFRQRVKPGNAHRRLKIRQETLNHYGSFCACCGETEPVFLTIDHINNDGAEHRRELGKSQCGNGFYYWLRRNNYPDTFQILCWNCNSAKHINGTCPHALTELKKAA